MIATPEELAQFKSNGRFKITDLMLEVHRYSDTPELGFSPIIGITDIAEGKTSTVEVLQGELDAQKEILERDKQETVALRELSLTSLETIRQHVKDWKVQESGKQTYTVTGFGLGWLDSKLTAGQWIFQVDTGQMTPVDKEGIALVSLLIAN